MNHHTRSWHSQRSEPDLELTSAASDMVSDYVADVKLRLMNEVARARAPQDEETRVTAAEIRDAIERVSLSRDTKKLWAQPARFRPLAAVFWLGVGLAPVSAFFLVTAGSVLLSEVLALRVAAVLAVLSVTLIGLSVMLLPTPSRRSIVRRENLATSQEFVRRMLRLEVDARNRCGQALDKKYFTADLGRLLGALERSGVWTTDDLATYRTLLRVRNALVHEDELPIGLGSVGYSLAEADRLIDLINNADTIALPLPKSSPKPEFPPFIE